MKITYLITGLTSAWILGGCATDSASSHARHAASPWIVLFDGKLNSQLRGYGQASFPSDRWVIDHGALKTIPGEAVDLITTQSFQDFELEFEWKVAPGGNSGVMYRVVETEDRPWKTGPEYQVLDDSRHPDGKNPTTTAGSLYALVAPNAAKRLKPVGEFNRSRIVLNQGHIEHWLNGAKVVEAEWGSPVLMGLVAQSKFKDMPRFMREPEGRITFQHHGEEAWFRNMRVRALSKN